MHAKYEGLSNAFVYLSDQSKTVWCLNECFILY